MILYVSPVIRGPGGSMSSAVGLPNNSYKPITNTAWFRARLCKLQKGAVASGKVYQLLAHFLGTPASSTTKTGSHDIAESGVKHNKYNEIKSNPIIIVLYRHLYLVIV